MLGGKFNLGALMKGAKKIQEIVEKNQDELAKLEIVGEAGAGLVTITMTGLYVVKQLILADDLLKEPKEVIEELIAAATNNATQKINQLARNKMGDMNDLLGSFSDDSN